MSSQMAKIPAFQPTRRLICASRTPVLTGFPARSAAPAYDRARVTPGIVHLGIGAFHRAHQAVVIDDLLAAGATDWGIIGASLRSAGHATTPSPRRIVSTRSPFAPARAPSTASSARCSTPKSRGTIPRRLIARMADPAHPHRLADGHREGLLPHAADRRSGRAPSRYRARPRPSGRAALGARVHRRRAGAPARIWASRPSRCCAATISPPMATPCSGS